MPRPSLIESFAAPPFRKPFFGLFSTPSTRPSSTPVALVTTQYVFVRRSFGPSPGSRHQRPSSATQYPRVNFLNVHASFSPLWQEYSTQKSQDHFRERSQQGSYVLLPHSIFKLVPAQSPASTCPARILHVVPRKGYDPTSGGLGIKSPTSFLIRDFPASRYFFRRSPLR